MPAILDVVDIVITKEWQLIIDDLSINSYRNLGTEIIYLCGTITTDDPPKASVQNTVALGGLIGKATLKDHYIWAKIPDDALENSLLRIIPNGKVDPGEDIASIVASIKNVQTQLTNHEQQLTVNIHKENKDTIGLGNIPNAISSNPNDDNDQILATTALTAFIKKTIDEHLETKSGNPHSVTKEEVGLGNVENFPIATESEAKDTLNNTTYMTPHLVSLQIDNSVKISTGVKPQCIIEGLEGERTFGWSVFDCNSPPAYLQKESDTSLVFKAGTKGSYAFDGKIFITETSKEDVSIPLTISSDGIKYVYADFDSDNNWVSFNMTEYPFKSGMTRDGYLYDFFNKANMTMYDSNNAIIRRLYIGTINVINGTISEVIPVPIGWEYLYPIMGTIPLGGSYIFLNPFIDSVKTIAEVKYLNTFGPTYWNDQIGVIASAYPRKLTTGPIPVHQIVVQIGLVGYLACGRESGSPFASNFQTITSEIPIRIRIIRDI